jgi:hypothetical protein
MNPFILPGILAGLFGLGGLGAGLTGGREALFGKNAALRALPNFTDAQQNLIGSLGSGVRGSLPGGLDFLNSILGQSPEAMQSFEAPALRQFREQIIPDIAQRFGELGALNSSGFTQSLGLGAQGLSERLNAQRSNLGFNALNQLQGLLGQSLTPTFSYMQMPAKQGYFSNFGNFLGSLGGLGGIS